MVTRIEAIKSGLSVVGIGLECLGFYILNISVLKPVIINGITFTEVAFPYRNEGYIVFFVGIIFLIISLLFNFIIKKRKRKIEET